MLVMLTSLKTCIHLTFLDMLQFSAKLPIIPLIVCNAFVLDFPLGFQHQQQQGTATDSSPVLVTESLPLGVQVYTAAPRCTPPGGRATATATATCCLCALFAYNICIYHIYIYVISILNIYIYRLRNQNTTLIFSGAALRHSEPRSKQPNHRAKLLRFL